MTMTIAPRILFVLCIAAVIGGGTKRAYSEKAMHPEEFPVVERLPDPFLFLDGTRVQTRDDWERRRAEMKALILGIQYGHMPDGSDPVTVRGVVSKEALHDGVTLRERHALTMGAEGCLEVYLDIYWPAASVGPFPVILNVGWDAPDIRAINERGYVFAGFGPEQFATTEEGRPSPSRVQQCHPEMDGGTLAAWAWGAARVLDYLETLPELDAGKVAITGHSRMGKAALLAGALDERFALVNPNGSGCGGAGLYRIQGRGSEDLEAITRPDRWQEWFHPGFRAFAGKENHLPFDQHFMRALVAPRPVLSTDGLEDFWANPLGTQMNYLAAQPVFDFLGAPNANGLHFREGGHDHEAEDYAALLAFADWHFFGKPSAVRFDALPFPERALEVDWNRPE